MCKSSFANCVQVGCALCGSLFLAVRGREPVDMTAEAQGLCEMMENSCGDSTT